MYHIETNGGNIEDDIDYQLWVTLDHLRYMIFKARRKELTTYNITPEQAQILYALGRIDSITINQMVKYSQHEHHSISTLINRMVNKGLVNKSRISGKGKTLYITLTEKGQNLLEVMSRESFSQVFTCLTKEDKQEMIKYFNRLLVSSYKALGIEHAPLFLGKMAPATNPDI